MGKPTHFSGVVVEDNVTVGGTLAVTGAMTATAAITATGGVKSTHVTLTPDDAESALNMIPAGVTAVRLGANVNDVNDFVVLPSLADVPTGHTITIVAGAANCEVRTPASSAEEINSEDCDGTKEYLLTATQVHEFVKIDDTIGWMGHGYSAIGAVVTAVVPD